MPPALTVFAVYCGNTLNLLMNQGSFKAVVIDDERATQVYLKGLLRKKFQVEVHEAYNGMEGLRMIERELPDFVLLDVNMPVLDGLEVLTAIRSDKNFANLPVIVLTSVKTQSVFKELMELGVTDYILKPIDYEFAIRRFSRFLKELRDNRQKNASSVLKTASHSDNSLLVIDPDLNFTKYFTNLLGRRFSVLEATNGADGLETYIKNRPMYTFIGDNLTLLNENLLAKKIRALSPNQARIFRLTDSDSENGASDTTSEYNGVILKSFVPDAFLKQLTTTVFGDNSNSASYDQIVREQMPSELFKAVNQTFGIMASVEISILDSEKADQAQVEIAAVTPLTNTSENIFMDVSIGCSVEDANWLTQIILGIQQPSRVECTEVLEEIIRTISGRVRVAFENFGILLEEQTSSVDFIDGGARANVNFDLSMVFQCDGARRFTIGLGKTNRDD